MTPARRWLLAALAAAAAPALAGPPEISIIIDDLGHGLAPGRRAAELPGPVACAILPGTPQARALAAYAHGLGKEVLLHLPLQSSPGRGPHEPGAILIDMSEARVAQAFEAALDAVPYAVGVNGHRGSLFTRHPGQLRWLMDAIRERGVFFVDSYTTHRSVALEIAGEAGVDAAKRDVFLDTDPSPEGIARELERLKRLARTNGRAVAIGHPYPATLAALERELPVLAAEGYLLVPVSRMLRKAPVPTVASQPGSSERRRAQAL